ncbi:MAG: glycosyltransferase family 4 protein [Verrucomicrobiales bacterium]|nr:glycosyltransferase family 4 protein [Verrucomicrobiales bacterium]
MRFLMLNWRDPENPLAGGAERVSLAFMRGLVERGHTVDWFTYAFPGGATEVVRDGIRYRREGGMKSAAWRARCWALRQPRYDLVIDQHHGLPWFAPWWCGTRCLAYIHEVLGPIWGSFYRWPVSTFGRWQERWTHRLYHRVPFWVPSESTSHSLMRHGVRDVHVLPNGVDVEPLEELPDKSVGNSVRLIAVSRLAPNKRVDHAIRAVALLRARQVPVELTVVGEGMVSGALRQLAADLGVVESVRFVGYQAEPAKLERLRESHLLVHPSVREGWGLNVIEANAMGTPAVVYPVDGLVDSTVDRVTGCVTARETPESLVDGIQWALASEGRYRGLREAAWKRSREFRWTAVIPRVCGFLEEVACGQKLV